MVKENWIIDISSTENVSMKTCFELVCHVKRAGPNVRSGFLSSLEAINKNEVVRRLRETEEIYKDNPDVRLSELGFRLEEEELWD